MAEGLFLQQVQEAGLDDQVEVASAGTGDWHIGELPDPRMRETARRNGVYLPSRAQQIVVKDLEHYDYVVPMDSANLREVEGLKYRALRAKATVVKMRAFDPEAPDEDVPDPYFGGARGFDEVFDMLQRSTANLLQHIRVRHGL